MAWHIITRLGRVILIVFAVSLIVFLLMHLTPGDPVDIMLPLHATEEMRVALRAKFGLDKPLPVQYYRFVASALRGDFGLSLQYRRSALELVLERYPNTFQLAFSAVGLALTIGLVLGVLAAVKPGGVWDRVAIVISMVGQSVPRFWLGLVLILVFAVVLRVLPTSGKAGYQHIILPTLTLSFGFVAQVVLIVRSGMMEVLQEDYIRTARAKGLGERAVIRRHALRNTLIPLVTFMGMVFGRLLGGAVITEAVFSWPGVGLLAVKATFARDYPLLQASVFSMSLGIAVINLLVDLCYGLLDPRIRHV